MMNLGTQVSTGNLRIPCFMESHNSCNWPTIVNELWWWWWMKWPLRPYFLFFPLSTNANNQSMYHPFHCKSANYLIYLFRFSSQLWNEHLFDKEKDINGEKSKLLFINFFESNVIIFLGKSSFTIPYLDKDSKGQ